MATDGPDPKPCDPDIYANGVAVLVTASVSSNRMERWVCLLGELSGQPVDWHFVGGRAVVKTTGDVEAVARAATELRPALDRLCRDSRRAEGLERFAEDSAPFLLLRGGG
jgi:3-methyladenine DNA glycosylase/8-oxoguanine DNA glycosylase